MPSAKRFALLRDTVRNHPVIVASTAASAGVLLGAFVAVQLLATPQPRADSAAAPQALASKPRRSRSRRRSPSPETTGSAPAERRAPPRRIATSETWPYLSRACMEEMRSKHRDPRDLDGQARQADDHRHRSCTAGRACESKPAAPAVATTAPVAAVAVAPGRSGRRRRPAVFAAPSAVACSRSQAPTPAAVATRRQRRGEEGKARRQEVQAKAESRTQAIRRSRNR